MKKLSEFKNEKGIEVAANVLAVIMDILAKKENSNQKNAKTPLEMFSAFMANSPAEMRKIFAILSETEADKYECNGAEAMQNMLILASDPILVGLFISQGRRVDVTPSGSALESIKD